MSDDPVTRPVAELSAGLRSGKLTGVALVESALGRIAALDPRLESFVCLADNARAQAAATDAEIGSGRWRGPLHGVPAAVKDNYYLTVDMPTRAGTDAPGITLDHFLTLWPTARTC